MTFGSGTLSKTLGALGGFVAGPARFTDLLVNRARSYIFTTASTPADTAAALAALRRAALPRRRRAAWHGCAPTSTACGRGTRRRSSRTCAAPRRARSAAADALAQRGLLVTAIRPPTVPPGTSRLRVALSAAHTTDQVDRLPTALHRALPRTARDPTAHAGVREPARPPRWARHGGRRRPRASCGWRARTSPPASRCSRVSRAAVTDARGPRRRHRRGPATPCARPTAPTPRRGRHRWQHESSAHPVSPSPTSSAGSSGPRASTSGWSRASAVHVRPISDDGDNVDLAHQLAPDLVVLVADAGLGTINAVRLSVTAFADFPVVVALNRFTAEPLPERNRAHLVDARRPRRGDRTARPRGAPPPTVMR